MEITQRTANLGDAAILLTWRNNASIREFSLNSNCIESEEHLDWLTARLGRVQFEPFFLFEANTQLIGMSRLDRAAGTANKFEISILVDPNKQGNGLGAKILDITCAFFFGLYPNDTIVSIVHERNFISQKLFLRAGFELVNTVGKFLHFEKSL
jgi:spore coat polysaccharide biosynthesis protein SpsF